MDVKYVEVDIRDFWTNKMPTQKQLAALAKLARLRAQGKAKRGRKKKPTKRKLMKQLRSLG